MPPEDHLRRSLRPVWIIPKDLWPHRVTVAVVALATFLAPLIAFAITGVYARYLADDYCTAYELNRHGFWLSQSYWYRGWSGRYAFTALVNLVESLGPRVTAFLPALAIGVWLVVTAWAIAQLGAGLGFRHRRLAVSLLAAALIATFFSAVPNLGQVLFWQTGVTTYVVPLILLTVIAGLLGRLLRFDLPPPRPAAAIPVVVGVAALLAGGFTETYALLQVSILFVALVAARVMLPSRRRRILVVPLLAGLVGAVLALVIVAAAPGNTARLSFFPLHPSLPELFMGSIRHGLGFLYYWTAQETISFIMALIFPVLVLFLLSPAPVSPPSSVTAEDLRLTRWLLLLPLLAVLLTIVCFVPGYWVLQSRPPDRTLAVPLYVLATLTGTWSLIAGRAIRRSTPHIVYPLAGATILVSLALCLLVLGPLQTTVTTLQVRPAMRDYAAGWALRDKQLRAAHASGDTEAVVAALPAQFQLGEIGPDSRGDVNMCAASYYGLRSIRTP